MVSKYSLVLILAYFSSNGSDRYCCTKLYCSIIGVSCTTVLYGTVDWRVGGAIGPLDDRVTSV